MFGRTITFSLVSFSLLLSSVPVLAGNLGLIEKRIEELDTLNKLIVRKVTTLPSRGVIHIQARVYDRPTTPLLVIISKNFSEIKEGTFPF